MRRSNVSGVRVARLPLIIALLILPLAVAGQNIGIGVVGLMLFVQIFLRRKGLPLRELKSEIGGLFVVSVAYVAWGLLSSVLNPAAPFAQSGKFAYGYLLWILLPPVAFLAQERLDDRGLRQLQVALAVVSAVMGGVAVTQAAYGWKLAGAHVVATIGRAQGFYSHPLTFAYVVMLFVPVGWLGVLKRPRDGISWTILLGGLAGVYASQSRTVQAVVAAAMVLGALFAAKGRARVVAAGVIAALGIGVAVTDNPMKERFLRTVSGGYDVKSERYADDRLAFWDVHREMFLERPLIGHGENISTAYRVPYYERLGLGALERKYEAHNTYLQIAVNGGLVGLAIFLMWFGLVFRRARGTPVAWHALLIFAVASLTQNSFQDSEVRFALTLLVTGLFLQPQVSGRSR